MLELAEADMVVDGKLGVEALGQRSDAPSRGCMHCYLRRIRARKITYSH
jgi:hypothetical protein